VNKFLESTIFSLILFLLPLSALAQSTVLQAGTFVPGHIPTYSTSSSVPVIQDGGSAAGGGFGIGPSEIALTIQGSGNPPFANTGNGPSFTNFCDYDAPTGSGSGYHYLCFSPNSGGGGLILYGQLGLTNLPLNIVSSGGVEINGVPIFTTTNVVRIITSGTTDIVQSSDYTIAWKSGVVSNKLENLPACNSTNGGQNLYIKDEIATSSTYPIKLLPASGTIELASFYYINSNSADIHIQCDGISNWMVM
jgi:hypothetical protein